MENKNKILVTGVIFLVILVGFLFVRSGEEKIITNYPSQGQDIIAYGDSLVEGVGASGPQSNLVSLLSSKIGQPIVNLGVSGNTTEDGFARLYELDKYNPKIVLLLLGGNDHLRKVPIEETFINLGKIIENIQARGAIVILLGIKGNLFGDKFEPEFEKLRDKYHTAYVSNVLDGLFGNNKYMSDTIHPNDLGYKVIADRIYPVLLKVLR